MRSFIYNYFTSDNKINTNDIKGQYNNNEIIGKIELNKTNEINTITMKYKIENYFIKIFGSKFVQTNKKICSIVFEGREYELKEYFQISQKYNKDILEIKLKNINNITDLNGLFNGCSDLISLSNISELVTSKVTNISNMFKGCISLCSLPDISKWNTTNVQDMSHLFSKCMSLKSLPNISNWKTSSLNNLNSIFRDCKGYELYILWMLIFIKYTKYLYI